MLAGFRILAKDGFFHLLRMKIRPAGSTGYHLKGALKGGNNSQVRSPYKKEGGVNKGKIVGNIDFFQGSKAVKNVHVTVHRSGLTGRSGLMGFGGYLWDSLLK
jgi:hypothetical protein